MKKRSLTPVLIVFLLLTLTPNLSGQEILKLLKAIHVTDKRLSTFQFPFTSSAAKQKPTGIKQRLIAHYFLNYFPVWRRAGDSSRLYWPENQGGDFNYTTLLNASDNSLPEYEDLLDPPAQTDSIVRYQTMDYISFGLLNTRTKNTLSSSGLLLSELYEDCIGGNPGNWENDQRNFYTYNNNDRLTSMTQEGWFNNTWHYSYQDCYLYGPTNRIKEQSYSVWDENTNAWDTLSKEVRERNSYNELTLATGYVSWNNVWENSSRDTFNYDVNHNRTLHRHQIWEAGAWQNADQTIFEYNAAQQRIADISQEWDINAQAWENTERLEYEYDANDKHISTTRQEWLDTSSGWRNAYQTLFSYTGDLVQTITNAYWDYNINQWLEIDRVQTEYNTNERLTAYWYEHLVPSGNWESWSGDIKHLFFYEDYNDDLSINKTGESVSDISVYPNPASTELQIHLRGSVPRAITVYSMEGKPVLKQEYLKKSDHFTIPLKQFTNGMYILKVQTDKGIKTKSFTVSR